MESQILQKFSYEFEYMTNKHLIRDYLYFEQNGKTFQMITKREGPWVFEPGDIVVKREDDEMWCIVYQTAVSQNYIGYWGVINK